MTRIFLIRFTSHLVVLSILSRDRKWNLKKDTRMNGFRGQEVCIFVIVVQRHAMRYHFLLIRCVSSDLQSIILCAPLRTMSAVSKWGLVRSSSRTRRPLLRPQRMKGNASLNVKKGKWNEKYGIFSDETSTPSAPLVSLLDGNAKFLYWAPLYSSLNVVIKA